MVRSNGAIEKDTGHRSRMATSLRLFGCGIMWSGETTPRLQKPAQPIHGSAGEDRRMDEAFERLDMRCGRRRCFSCNLKQGKRGLAVESI